MKNNKKYNLLKLFQEAQSAYQHIIIYSSGENTRWLLEQSDFEYRKDFISAIVDDNSLVKSINNIPVIKPDDYIAKDHEVILLSSDYFDDLLLEKAKVHFTNNAKILRAYHDINVDAEVKHLSDTKQVPFNDIISLRVGEKSLKFWNASDVCKNRVKTFYIKEPETLEWIDTFSETSIFWDIGANIGLYSLYAALRSHNVFSFEPEASNYYALINNIALNPFQAINAYNIAFAQTNSLGNILLSDIGIGKALHSFESTREAIKQDNQFMPKQNSVGLSIDTFVELFSPQIPNYIKIDVDGIEEEILLGAKKTLTHKCIKGLMVELDINMQEKTERVKQLLGDCGLDFIIRSRSPMFENSRFASNYNHFFERRE